MSSAPPAPARRRALVVLAAGLLIATAVVAAPAAAAVTAKASVVTAGGATRLQVTLSGAKSRPAGVVAVVGGKSFTLARAGSRWRSGKLAAADIALVQKASGKKITVRLRSGATRTTLRAPLSVPAGGATTPTAPATPVAPAQPAPPAAPGAPALFPPPAQKLTGNAAAQHLAPYFLNSRFTDCPQGGWPLCAVEERYDHCNDGSWTYFRITPSVGSDINSYGSFQVTGAEAYTDGSWIVEYIETLAGGSQSFYSWSVGPTGAIAGRYWRPGTFPPQPPSQLMSGLQWVRPWNACGVKF